MRLSEPGCSRLMHPVVDAIEPRQSDNNEIDRNDEVQQPRHDQNEDAGNKGDKRRDMFGGDDHGFPRDGISTGGAPGAAQFDNTATHKTPFGSMRETTPVEARSAPT